MKLITNLISTHVLNEIATPEPAAVTAVTGLFEQLYSWLKIVATPLAILMIGVLAVRLYLSSDEQSARKIKGALVVVIVGILLLYLAPTIVSTVEELFPAESTAVVSAMFF